ncbi:3-hydroxyacyl-CoA dehydrogenase family protein [Tropicimonas sediminicola]|uniref:3-hydroxyacyl-CoA dehydrogenase n=1 Tax=Tropicimonas sediminicola TaxID=1031541 RepID=A0A239FCF4_9RHOB|nr:3-hydroxyacyl-CoA dehydrogenase family protein [Tropicimonas sediminicola]SNS54589.1 3-hydroxyacyl-CoA dehydrogenase [Tropicimonas sediminicola]
MAARPVEVERIGSVGLLALAPGWPGPRVRAGLMAALDAFEEDAEVKAAVLVLPEVSGRWRPEATVPALPDLCDTLECCRFPVVAALAGCARGPLAELALAAHFRLAADGPCLEFPGIATGTLEGGGATQRLPRIAGAEVSLNLLLGGAPLSAEAAKEAGLLDGLVRGDLVETALALAERLAEGGVAPLRARDRREGQADRDAYHAAISVARERAEQPGSSRIIECVEAALLLPFEAGVGFERATADALQNSDEARALHHVVTAEERLASARPAEAPTIGTVSLEADDEAGADLALALLEAGVALRVREAEAGVLSQIGQALSDAVREGRIGEAERRARLALLRSDAGASDFARSDLHLRVASGDGRLPRSKARAGALATVIAPRDPDPAADGARIVLSRPFRVGDVAEILPDPQGTVGETEGLAALLHRIGARPLICRRPGRSALGRLVERFRAAAEHLLEDGATPAEIDAAMEAAGFSLGPFRSLDREGLLGPARRRQQAATIRDPRDRYVTVLDRLVAAGRLGQASGRGFYDYPAGIPEGLPSGEVERLVEEARRDAGTVPQRISAERIVERMGLALALAGLEVIGDGLLRDPAEVDLAAVHGLGFPRHRGGPMYQAGLMGWSELRRRLGVLASREDARFWAPPAILDEAVARGGGLSALAPAA